MFIEKIPSSKNTSKIESIWFYQENCSRIDFKVLPDTCIDLIFDLNKNTGFVSGFMTHYQMVSLFEKSNLIGVRLKAESFASLSKIPLTEFKNKRIEFIDLNWNSTIVEKLNESKNTDEQIGHLEYFIGQKQNKQLHNEDELILAVAANIRRLNGKIKVKELAQSHLIGIRQLERRFKNYVGVTLKEFSNSVRFINAVKAISKFQQKSLLEIAFDAGYFDHAHMNNNFKFISGENPSSFR